MKLQHTEHMEPGSSMLKQRHGDAGRPGMPTGHKYLQGAHAQGGKTSAGRGGNTCHATKACTCRGPPQRTECQSTACLPLLHATPPLPAPLAWSCHGASSQGLEHRYQTLVEVPCRGAMLQMHVKRTTYFFICKCRASVRSKCTGAVGASTPAARLTQALASRPPPPPPLCKTSALPATRR